MKRQLTRREQNFEKRKEVENGERKIFIKKRENGGFLRDFA